MNRSTNIAEPTKAFEFLQLAKSLLAAGGSNNDAVRYAEETKASPRVVAFLKATPGNSTSGWGADLTDMAASGVAYLASKLARLSGAAAEQLIDRELRAAIGTATDRMWLNAAASSRNVQSAHAFRPGTLRQRAVRAERYGALNSGGEGRSKKFDH
jgi:hypothetical protein